MLCYVILIVIGSSEDSRVMKDDLLNQIADKEKCIYEYMGDQKGSELIGSIQSNPEEYIDISQAKCVRELANLILQRQMRDINNGDLYRMIKKLEDKIDKLENRGWRKVGQLKDVEQLFKEYDPFQYTYGVEYNWRVLEVIFNHWNRGIRMSTLHSYPMGDDSTKLKFGRSVFTKGLDDKSDKNNWYHYYYYISGDQQYAGNGNANSVKIFAKPI